MPTPQATKVAAAAAPGGVTPAPAQTVTQPASPPPAPAPATVAPSQLELAMSWSRAASDEDLVNAIRHLPVDWDTRLVWATELMKRPPAQRLAEACRRDPELFLRQMRGETLPPEVLDEESNVRWYTSEPHLQ